MCKPSQRPASLRLDLVEGGAGGNNLMCAGVSNVPPTFGGSSGTCDLVEQLVEPADQADSVRSSPDCEQCPSDVRRRSLTGVVANRQPLALRGEDEFRRDDEAREAKRVHLRASDGRS